MGFDITTFPIPLWSLLVFYSLFLLFFCLYTIFNVYHLVRFGTYGFGLYLITAVFLFGSVVLLAISFTMLSSYDWTTRIPISDYIDTYKSEEFFKGI